MSSLFSMRLKWLREKMGWSQKALAEKLKMSQQGYSKIELGQREPNLETLFNLRHIFNEPLDFIVGYHVEDVKADNLFQLYVEVRQEREEIEEKIAETNEIFEGTEYKLEDKLRIRIENNEELRKAKAKEEKAFQIFFNYLKTIPLDDEETEKKYYNPDFWIEERYEIRLAEIDNLNVNFYEEYDKL